MMPRALNAYCKECMVLSDQTLCDAFYEVAKVAKASFENMQIERVIFNAPATVVYWKDGTKTVVKCQDGDKYSKETGLAMAIVKKVYGNSGAYNDIMKTWIKD